MRPPMNDRRPTKKRSQGFTLLEVILALALSTLVLAAIGLAISSHLRFLEAGRQGVEEAQLARAILSGIADDLRNAVPYQPDQGSTSASNSSSAAGGTSTPPTGGGDEDSLETNPAESAESTEEASSLPEDLSTASPQATPGLYGNAEQLEVDVSRLPRREQLYLSLNASGQSPLENQLCDVKNVVYYVLRGGMTASPTLPAAPASEQGQGLFRRELDRTLALTAVQQGDQTVLEQATQSLAPEVEAIQFRYFDGQEWLEQWDSSTTNCLPTAVEIQLQLTRHPATSRQAPTAVVYRLVVYLPAAQATTQSNTESTTETATGSAMSSSASSSNSGGQP
jgi:prepilin-type N-terminal cleavage/methylation domain-containing protein